MKRIYIAPEIETIQLDHEISLALESTPPNGPDETLNTREHFTPNDPYNPTLT
ncbi:MAG: hypothetical protein ACP5F6_00230 [Microbacter sp.]